MSFDVAVVGAPFLDLTFEDLPRLPAPGEEVAGTGLHIDPGGTGMQAVAAARLGLRTALISPKGKDPAGRILAGLFDAEGVTWLGPPAERTPVTAILGAGGAPAMATFHPPDEVSADEVGSVEAEALVLSLGRLPLRPPGMAAYAITGPQETGRFGPADLPALDGVRAVLMNEREARSITTVDDPASAARLLAEHAEAAVVTRGPDGALAAATGSVVEVPAPDVAVIDTTGAGDLFVAAYVWADRRELDLEGRLRWATLYASLSTRAPTAFAGALRLEELLAAGEAHRLTPP